MIVRAYRYDEKGLPRRMGTIDDIELIESDFEDGRYEFVQNEKKGHIKRRFLKQSGFEKIYKFYPDWDWEDNYSYLGIVSEERLAFEAEQRWRHEYYMKMVTDAMREGKSITNLTKYKCLTDKCPISPEYLLHYGWELKEDTVIKSISDERKKQLESEGIKFFEEYTFVAKNKDADEYKGYWFITMRYDLSNTVGRDWFCHIDNALHESVACVDIGTIEQFNILMKLMDIEYRLR